MGVREARRLLKDGVIRGFKFHPTLQGFFPNDRIAYPLYELIAEHKLPAIFHSGHSGMGTGMPGGGGLRLKYSNPIHLDDVAADFPDMKIIIAHPSWPWQDEALSVCLHKPNVYIDLPAGRRNTFTAARKYANTRSRAHVVRVGLSTDHAGPMDQDFREAGFRRSLIASRTPSGRLDSIACGTVVATSWTRIHSRPNSNVVRRRMILRPGELRRFHQQVATSNLGAAAPGGCW
jgi:hypothetical protein